MSEIIGVFGAYGAGEDSANGIMDSVTLETKTVSGLVRDVGRGVLLYSGGIRSSHTVLDTSALACAQECCARRHIGVFRESCAWAHTGCGSGVVPFNSQIFPRLMWESSAQCTVQKFKDASRMMGGRRTYIGAGSGFLVGVNMDDLLFVGKKTIHTGVALTKEDKEQCAYVIASSPRALSALSARFIRGVFARESVTITRAGVVFERIA